MHRVIAGFNLWGVLFLLLALGFGLQGSPHHLPIAVFATLFALLAQCSIFALFMGASKLLKEHVERFVLPTSLIERTNALMIPLFRWAAAGSLTIVAVAFLGGLTASGEVPGLVHALAGILLVLFLIHAIGREVPLVSRMHEILLDMEKALPEPGESLPVAESVPDLRARALVYVGSTSLVMVLGYKYVAGLLVPATLTAIVIGFSLVCLGLAAGIAWRARPSS